MKRILLTFLLALPLAVAAQVRMGYLSYNKVMQQMPEYAQAQEELTTLKTQYDNEATRSEEEFQRKFTEFLQGQKDFPQNILLKRQGELQSLMENGIDFRLEAQKLLTEAEQDLLAQVSAKLDEAIRAVGDEGGYLCIINTDANQCPYINSTVGDDVTYAVMMKLGLVSTPLLQIDPVETNVAGEIQ